MQCAARRTFSGKVVGGAFERCSSSYQQSGSLAVTREKGNGINHDDKYYNARVLLLAQSEKRHRMEVRTTRDLVQPMISIRQGVKSAHDRVPKRRGRDCPRWPRFATQMASGAQILHSLYRFR